MTDQHQNNAPQANWVCIGPQFPSQEEDEIDLVALMTTVWRWRWFIGAFTLTCTLVAVIVSLWVMPVLYTSNAVIQPSQPETNSLSSLTALAQFLPVSIPTQSNKNQVMINYLNSRELKIWLIEKFDLLQRYNPDSWDAQKKVWLVDQGDEPTVTKMLQQEALKDVYSEKLVQDTGLINISFSDEDPTFAARVVGGIIDELDRYLKDDYITDAKRNRIFVEGQVANTQKSLEYWEKEVPSQTITANQIQRELLAATTVYSELKKQFELAKIEEDKQLVSFKVLDPPLVPEIKSSPQRTKICIITLLTSGFMSLLLLFIIEFSKNVVRKRDQCGQYN